MVGSQTTKWPFIPTSLNDILDSETLTVIESGSCERLGRPLTILDFDSQTGSFTHRIELSMRNSGMKSFVNTFATITV